MARRPAAGAKPAIDVGPQEPAVTAEAAALAAASLPSPGADPEPPIDAGSQEPTELDDAEDLLVQVIAVAYPGLSPGVVAHMTPAQAEIEIARGTVRPVPRPDDDAG